MSCGERMEDVWLWWLEKRRWQEGWWQCALCYGNGEAALSSWFVGSDAARRCNWAGSSYQWPGQLNTGAGSWGTSWTPSLRGKARGDKHPPGTGGVKLVHPQGTCVPPAHADPPSPQRQCAARLLVSSARSIEIGLTTHLGAEGVWSCSRKRPIFVTTGETSKCETRKKNRGNNNFIYFFIYIFLK